MVTSNIVNELFILILCCLTGNARHPQLHGIVTPQGDGTFQNLQEWPVPFYSDNNFGIIPIVVPPQPAPVIIPVQVIPTPVPTMPPSTIGRINNFITPPVPFTDNNIPLNAPPMPKESINPSLMVNYSGNPNNNIANTPPLTTLNKSPAVVPPIVLVVDPAYMMSYSTSIPPHPLTSSTAISNVSTNLPSPTNATSTELPKFVIDPAYMISYSTNVAPPVVASPATITSTTQSTLASSPAPTTASTTVSTNLPSPATAASTELPKFVIDPAYMISYSTNVAPPVVTSPATITSTTQSTVASSPAATTASTVVSTNPTSPATSASTLLPKFDIDHNFIITYSTNVAGPVVTSPVIITSTVAPSTAPTTASTSTASSAVASTSTFSPTTATSTTTIATASTAASTPAAVSASSPTQTLFTSDLLTTVPAPFTSPQLTTATSKPTPSSPALVSTSISLLPTAVNPVPSALSKICENTSTTNRPLGLDCGYKPPELSNQVTMVNPGGTSSTFQIEVPAVIKFDLNITAIPNYVANVLPVTQDESDVVEIGSATANRLVSSPDTTISLSTVNVDLSDPHLNIGWSTPGLPPNTPAPLPQIRISQQKCIEYYSTGRRNTRKSQVTVFIIGGQNSQQKEFPHMAALGYGAKNDNQWLCGGSLISENFVVTAAHCLTARSIGPVQFVRLGTTTLQTETLDSVDYNVIRRIAYPYYIEGRQYDDIALLQLDRPVAFTEYIAPICLFSAYNLAGIKLTATGWGRTGATGNVAVELQKVELDYVPNDVCQKAYSVVPKDELPYGILDASQLCAGSQDGSKDTCQGDSGGPLQLQQDGRLYLTGITSFGISCGQPGVPGVYTRVSNYVPWIEQVIWGRQI